MNSWHNTTAVIYPDIDEYNVDVDLNVKYLALSFTKLDIYVSITITGSIHLLLNYKYPRVSSIQ
jgi:hypothetical protein